MKYPGFYIFSKQDSSIFHLATSSVSTICGKRVSSSDDKWQKVNEVEDGGSVCKNCRSSILSKRRDD